jgi:Zn finger protein HypA/HybF involved in hydrogenase expression
MGWNDHVEYFEVECLDCGVTDTWEYWDDVAKARYVGEIAKMVNVDTSTDAKCPHCGSINGRYVPEPRRLGVGSAADDVR